jgi:hypothetical protein
MGADYGDDLSTFGLDGSIDIDFDRVIQGPRVVLEAVARRWLMSLGALPWAPTEGVNLLRAVNADLSPTDLFRLAQSLELEALQEPGVLGASVLAELVDGGRLRVVGQLDLQEGTLPLILEVGGARGALVSFARGAA